MSARNSFTAILLGVGLWTTGHAQPTQLSIDRNSGPVRIGIQGEAGGEYVLETAPENFEVDSWETLLTVTLTNNLLNWFDSASAQAPRRFYRAVKLDSQVPPRVAPDFRLIDHQDRTRALYYYFAHDPGIGAVVLIFTGNGCAKVHEMVSAIKSLRDQFASQGVLFWLIDSNSADNRSNIVAEAGAQGIDLPILHDAAQLVAREYGATATPEAFVLKKTEFGWFVVYQGAIDDRIGGSTNGKTQPYLTDALAASLAEQPVIISRTKAGGCAVDLNPPQIVSYSADIAPLLQRKCVHCHSPGNIAPWSMTNYTVVKSYAALIKSEVLNGDMPPWRADPHYGVFANDSSLSPQEAAALVQWVNAGAPGGTGADPLETTPLPPTNYPSVWPPALGQPDQVLSIPTQMLPASGVLDYRYFSVTNTFTNDVWLRAAIVLPGNTRVVHHCLVYEGGGLMGLDGFFAGFVPGYSAAEFPSGTGKLLRKGTPLTFQMHYITTGRAETDQTQIGLYVAPAPPQYTLQTKSAFNPIFFLGLTTIPPGTNDFEITAQYPTPTIVNPTPVLTKNILLYEMSPHMHLRGSRFRYEALYPNGTREVLLSVPRYEFHWQALYRLTEPKYLPAGSRIICTGAWDNSARNHANPDPTATVRWGDQTDDEMFIGYFNFAEVP
jgi:hypothetical protein